ncbi:hypothetical protein B0H14DRAFT_2890036, partial [Mycena olivaceomarginata]
DVNEGSHAYTESDDEPASDLEGPELVEFYQAVATKLKAQRNDARSQREGADAHAVIAGLHIRSLQKKLITKTKKRGGNARTLAASARILTSAEGRTLAEEKRNTELQKKTKQDESKTQKLLASAEVLKRRRDLGRDGMVFDGNIKSLKAPQLKDLAWLLALEEDGTREVLIARILECFATNNVLKEDKHYIDLWTRRRRAAIRGHPRHPIRFFGRAVDHPPPFPPEFYDHPPSDFYSTRHPPNPYDLPYGPSPLHYQ